MLRDLQMKESVLLHKVLILILKIDSVTVLFRPNKTYLWADSGCQSDAADV